MDASVDQPGAAVGRGRVARAVRQIQDGYGLTLVLTILTVACLAASGVGTGGGLVAVMLTGATLLFALSTSRARPRVMRTAQSPSSRSPSPRPPSPSSRATHRLRRRRPG